jgi:hypothetical protein
MFHLDTKTIYNRLKSSAKKRNIPFDLSVCELNHLSFPLTCPILGIPLKYNKGNPQDDSFSIDRIDSSLGYTIDNIEVISYKANRMKNNGTPEEIQLFVEYYRNK